VAGRIHAVIPARAGSKRVPGKNVRPVRGRPLVWYSIRAAQQCPTIGKIVVSSDDETILAIAREAGVEAHRRPAALASDIAPTFAVLKALYADWIERGDAPDLLVLLQPTSPLRRAGMIDDALARMTADPRATSLVSVYESRLFTGRIEADYWIGDYPEETRSQDIPPKYVPSGSLFVYRCAETIARNDAYGAHTLPLIEDAAYVVNIDHESDFHRLTAVLDANPARFAHLMSS
jgi:CMP-N-acetylneuraminic acid synthetase